MMPVAWVSTGGKRCWPKHTHSSNAATIRVYLVPPFDKTNPCLKYTTNCHRRLRQFSVGPDQEGRYLTLSLAGVNEQKVKKRAGGDDGLFINQAEGPDR